MNVSAVFDTIDFDILINKLSAYGFSNLLIKWFKSFLSNHSITMQYENFVSNFFKSTMDTAQESSCGPLAFIIYIDDLFIICC